MRADVGTTTFGRVAKLLQSTNSIRLSTIYQADGEDDIHVWRAVATSVPVGKYLKEVNFRGRIRADSNRCSYLVLKNSFRFYATSSSRVYAVFVSTLLSV